MKHLGAANLILWIEIKRNHANKNLQLNQRKYIETILFSFSMQECKPIKVSIPVGVRISAEQCPKTQEEEQDMSHVPYARVVWSLMYSMVCTRPYIAHAVGVLSRCMSKLGKEHWTTIKRVFRYLHGTIDHAIYYQGRVVPKRVLDVHGFIDANYVGDLDHRRYTSGYVLNLFKGVISWMRKKQVVVALSTTKVEYMPTTHASKEDVWLQRLCLEIGFK